MYVYVHTFPDGHRPAPQVVLEKGDVVSLQEISVKGERDASGKVSEQRVIQRVVVEKGKVNLLNVPFTHGGEKQPFVSGDMTIEDSAELQLPQ